MVLGCLSCWLSGRRPNFASSVCSHQAVKSGCCVMAILISNATLGFLLLPGSTCAAASAHMFAFSTSPSSTTDSSSATLLFAYWARSLGVASGLVRTKIARSVGSAKALHMVTSSRSPAGHQNFFALSCCCSTYEAY